MGMIFYRPPLNPDGTKMSYEQRRAARKALEAERPKPEPPTRPDFFKLPYAERKRIREAEQLGKCEAAALAETQEAARRAAEWEATPEHLRRPENTWRRLIAEWEGQAFRPEIARKLEDYRRRADEEDKRIDALMEDKRRRFEIESNPETAKAREHLDSASAAAETLEEQREWARLRGLVEAGQADAYWEQVRPILEARLSRIRDCVAAEEASRDAQEARYEAAKAEADATEGLLE